MEGEHRRRVAAIVLALSALAVPAISPSASAAAVPGHHLSSLVPAATGLVIDQEVVSGPGPVTVGDVVEREYTVTDESDLVVRDLAVSLDRDDAGDPVTCRARRVSPGSAVLCRSTHVVTAADVAAGSTQATALATGTDAGDRAIVSTPVSSSVPTAAAGLELAASAAPDSAAPDSGANGGGLAVGDVVDYRFEVTNASASALSGLQVRDRFVGADRIACLRSRLEPGATTTCRARHTVTQDDVDAAAVGDGRIVEIANAVARTDTGTGVTLTSPQATVAVAARTSTGLRLTRSVTTGSGPVVQGDVIGYDVKVVNTGDLSVDALVVDDPALDDVVCERSGAVSGQGTHCAGTHRVTRADVDAGKVRIGPQVSALAADGAAVRVTANPVTVPTARTGLRLDRGITVTGPDGAPTDEVVAGDVVAATFRVTNSTDEPVSGLVVSDPLIAPVSLTCTETALEPDAETECRGTYRVRRDDVDAAARAAGSIVDTSAAVAQAAGVPVASAQAVETIPVGQRAAVEVVQRISSGQGPVVAGGSLDLELTVRNVGDVSLSRPRVVSDQVSGFSCDTTFVPPGTEATCRGTRLVTLDDVAVGSVVIDSRAEAEAVGGETVRSASVHTSTVASRVEGLDLTTTVERTSRRAGARVGVGDTVTLRYRVTTSGDEPVTGLEISDGFFRPGQVSCAATEVRPDEPVLCGGTFVVTQADVDQAVARGGPVLGRASASGRSAGSVIASPQATVSIPVEADLGVRAAVEVTTGSGPAGAGDLLGLRYTVTNSGAQTLHGVRVVASLGARISCGPGSKALAASRSLSCVGSHRVTAKEAESGRVAVTGRATALGVSDGRTRSEPVAVEAPTTAKVALQVAASVENRAENRSGGGLDRAELAVGATVDYLVTVTNVGASRVSQLVASGSPLPSTQTTCSPTVIEPGEVSLCRGTGVLTQADIDEAASAGGRITETFSAQGTTFDSGPVGSRQGTVTLTGASTAGLELAVRSVAGAGPVSAGEDVDFLVTVTNSAEQGVDGIDVTSDRVPGIVCGTTALGAGEQTTCRAVRGAAPGDDGAARFAAEGRAADGAVVAADPATAPLPAVAPEGLTISVKSDVDPFAGSLHVGDPVALTYDVVNTSSEPVDDVAVVDGFAEPGSTECDATTLDPGASTSCNAVHVLTQDDVDLAASDDGTLTTPVHAVATRSGDDQQVVSPRADVVVDTATQARLEVQHSVLGTPRPVVAGDVVAYGFVVVNTGDLTLRDVTVQAPDVGGVTCDRVRLAAGESAACTGRHIVSQDDVQSGSVTSTARATATVVATPTREARSAPDSASVATSSRTGLQVVVETSVPGAPEAGAHVGGEVEYRIEVTNVGDKRVADVVPSIARFPDAGDVVCEGRFLDVGKTLTCRASYTVTQDDVDAAAGGTGSLADTVTVSGRTGAISVTSAPARTEVRLDTSSGLRLGADTSAPLGPVVAGETVEYTYTVTNSGAQSVGEVEVRDPGISDLTCDATTLAADDRATCSGRYVVRQEDVEAGTIKRTARAEGVAIDGRPVEASVAPAVSTSVRTELELTVAVEPLEPTAPADADGAAVGDEVAVTYTARNQGDLRVEHLTVEDDGRRQADCAEGALEPGEETTCTTVTTVTQADVDSGGLVISGRAVGTSRVGTVVSTPTTRAVATQDAASLSLAVDAAVRDDPLVAGDVVRFRLTVTNTGDLTARGLEIVGAHLGDVDCGRRRLASGESVTCTGAHLVSQGEVDAGSLDADARARATVPSPGADSPDSASVESNTDATSQPASSRAGLSLARSLRLLTSGPGTPARVGDAIELVYDLANTGDVTLSELTLRSTVWSGDEVPDCGPLLGERGDRPAGTVPDLPPGAVVRCSVLAAVSQDAVDTGAIRDHSVVSAATRGGQVVSAEADDVEYPTAARTGLTLDASVSGLTDRGAPGLSAGDLLRLSIVVANTGDLSVSRLLVEGERLEHVRCPREILGSRVAVTCSADVAVGAEDLSAGDGLVVAVRARSTAATGEAVSTYEDDLVVPVADPSVTLDQRATGTVDRADDGLGAGDLVRYTYAVTNLGTEPVRLLEVGGEQVTADCADIQIDIGSTVECHREVEISAADERRGSLTSTAGATVRTTSGDDVTVRDDTSVTPLPGNRDAPRYQVLEDQPEGSGGRPWWIAVLALLVVAGGITWRRRCRSTPRA